MTGQKISCRRILVVDDDEVMRELLPALLAMEGYAVHTAASGAEALDWLASAEGTIDILLIDLQMPGMEGCELAARLKEVRGPETLLIGMSGSEPTAGVRAFFDAFLQKPFGMEAFGAVVERGSTLHAAAARDAAASPAKKTAGPGRAAASVVLDEAVYARLAAILPPAQLHELYQVSMDDVLRRVELMRAASANSDFAQCRREAHAIKGGCSMVGATELSALASEVEEGSFGGTPPLPDFAAACSRLRRMLDARL